MSPVYPSSDRSIGIITRFDLDRRALLLCFPRPGALTCRVSPPALLARALCGDIPVSCMSPVSDFSASSRSKCALVAAGITNSPARGCPSRTPERLCQWDALLFADLALTGVRVHVHMCCRSGRICRLSTISLMVPCMSSTLGQQFNVVLVAKGSHRPFLPSRQVTGIYLLVWLL